MLRRSGDSSDRLQELARVRVTGINIERVLYRTRGFTELSADRKCAPEHDQSVRIGGQERCSAWGMGNHLSDIAALVEKR